MSGGKSQSVFVEDKFSGNYQEWVVVNYNNATDVVVQCVEDGYITTTSAREIRLGNVRNPFYRQVAGIGFVGVGKYSVKNSIICYQKWSGMLHRVYDEKRKNYQWYGGRGVKVCDTWHNYQKFAEWFYSQPNFMVKNIELDKDILDREAKLYSSRTCTLVPQEVNKAVMAGSVGSGLLSGVAKTNNKTNTYRARCYINGKMNNIGVYGNELQAHIAYVICKEEYVRSLAYKYKEDITESAYKALIDWSVYA
jgi:hypothetical protein